MIRFLGYLIVALIGFAIVVYVTSQVSGARQPRPLERLDASGTWLPQTRASSPERTEVSIVRVTDGELIVERRVLGVLDNLGEDYAERLAALQDRAVQHARDANARRDNPW